MKVSVIKTASGALIPASEIDFDLMKKIKSGEAISVEVKQIRNYQLHKKAFSLLQLCYEKFCSNIEPASYKGEVAKPCFETWREQFIILAGHYEVTFDIKGKIKLKAKSLSFANCNQEQFERIYSDLINCALKHTYDASMTERELRDLVEQILRYA